MIFKNLALIRSVLQHLRPTPLIINPIKLQLKQHGHDRLM